MMSRLQDKGVLPMPAWRRPHHTVLFAVAAVLLFAGVMLAPVEASGTELIHVYSTE
jgi:hypothetical protein